jgi:Uma2 family endonuclease
MFLLCAAAPQTHENSNDILVNPQVVIEVLSPSAAGYDRGRKFERYREIASLRDYILVHADWFTPTRRESSILPGNRMQAGFSRIPRD